MDCRVKPGNDSWVFCTVPALRSGMKNAAARPGHEALHLRGADHHPWNPELVDAHAKTFREEGRPEWHVDRAACCERLELRFRVREVLDGERDGKALRLLEMAGWRVGG